MVCGFEAWPHNPSDEGPEIWEAPPLSSPTFPEFAAVTTSLYMQTSPGKKTYYLNCPLLANAEAAYIRDVSPKVRTLPTTLFSSLLGYSVLIIYLDHAWSASI